MPIPTQFDNVTAVCKANVYFDGKVVSHSILLPDGSKKSLGLIFPGSHTFNTEVAENMAIVDGQCRAKIAGEDDWKTYGPGDAFDVAAGSSFEIAVAEGVAQYVCSFG